MRLLYTFTKVPADTKIPLTVEEALLPARSQILFLNTLVLVAPDTTKPETAAPAVLDMPLMELLLMFTMADVLEQVMPVTAPPVPVERILKSVLDAIFKGFPPLKLLPT